MSGETIVRLYDALSRHDGDAAASCYTDDAVFTDPAFGRLDPGDVQLMWSMLTERSEDLEAILLDHGTEGDRGWARWSARYTFGGSGRSVINNIDSRFVFRGALIAEQIDSFSLRKWGRQALGARGMLLGATPLLGRAVRSQARSGLDAYRS